MRLTYKGNHVFVLPKKDGGFQTWKKGETHPVDPSVWVKMQDKKTVQSMKKNGLLTVLGQEDSLNEKKESKEPEKKESSPKLPEEAKEERDSDSDPKKDLVREFSKLPYKTAIKRLDELDSGLLHRLHSVEHRPSVLKAIKDKLGK